MANPRMVDSLVPRIGMKVKKFINESHLSESAHAPLVFSIKVRLSPCHLEAVGDNLTRIVIGNWQRYSISPKWSKDFSLQ